MVIIGVLKGDPMAMGDSKAEMVEIMEIMEMVETETEAPLQLFVVEISVETLGQLVNQDVCCYPSQQGLACNVQQEGW